MHGMEEAFNDDTAMRDVSAEASSAEGMPVLRDLPSLLYRGRLP